MNIFIRTSGINLKSDNLSNVINRGYIKAMTKFVLLIAYKLVKRRITNMHSRIKKLWVKALRSGEFNQGIGFLELNGKYCALGVLSVLCMLEGECTYDLENGTGKYDNKKLSLSLNTMRWAGIAQEDENYLDPKAGNVELYFRNKKTTISNLNDEGKSF
jgi:hypothetical protein